MLRGGGLSKGDEAEAWGRQDATEEAAKCAEEEEAEHWWEEGGPHQQPHVGVAEAASSEPHVEASARGIHRLAQGGGTAGAPGWG